MPSWLNFEPVTRTFSGTLSAAGSFLIKVTATDNKEASTSCTFTLKVSTLTTVKQIIEQNIQLYPNPTDGNFTVKLGKIPCNDYHIEILDLDGRPVLKKNISNAVDATIDLTGNPKGIYLLNLFVDSELIFKKICLE